MDFTQVFFIILSILVLFYFIYSFKHGKRLPIIVELFFLGSYGFVMIIFLFPKSLRIIEEVLGIQNAINFIVYLSIFVAYVFLFLLYKKSEDQRLKLTKLNREVALKNGKNKSK